MKFYPKKLQNMESLKREKKILLKEMEELDKDDFLSIESILGGKDGGEKNASGGIGSLLDMLPTSGPLVNTAINLVQGLLKGRDDGGKTEQKDKPRKKKKNKSLLNSIAKEFIGGYLKWKAVELSFKGIKYIIKSHREKKEQEI